MFHGLMAGIRAKSGSMNPRLLALTAAASLLPAYGGAHNRARQFAKAGFRAGAGTLFHGTPRISGNSDLVDKLTIRVDGVIGESSAFGAEKRSAIGDHVVKTSSRSRASAASQHVESRY